MRKFFRRLRARALHVSGLVSKRDLRALQTRLDTLIQAFDGQTDLLARADLALSAAARDLEHMQRLLGTGGRLTHIERNLHALIRGQFVDHTTLPFPHRILAQRFHVDSQNGEDGITLALIDLAGTTNRRFLTLGADANGGNTGFLAETCGWTGLVVDGNAKRVGNVAARFARYGIDTKPLRVTPDNVNQVARDHHLDGDIDLLSVDLDGIDYWVWRALETCSPRLVILRFNEAFGAERAVTVPYDPAFERTAFKAVTHRFFGASLAACEQLGSTKGYRLVMVAPGGVKAYLLRNDVAPQITASPARVLHPRPGADAQPLFDLIAEAGLSLVDVASDEGRGNSDA